MRFLSVAILAGMLLANQPNYVSVQAKTATRVFLLENAGNHQWCAYNKESTWKAAVQNVEAMTVGTLTYSNDHLSRIDVTETDESGDWMAYDHYFLNDRGEIVKLLRMINVLPGDRSVLQTYSITNGNAKKINTTERWLSTGKPLTSPKPVWLPHLPIETQTKLFPFSGLLASPNLRTASKTCVRTSEVQ